MRQSNIKIKFDITTRRYPGFSSYLCYAHTVMGLSLDNRRLRYYFYKLVDRNMDVCIERDKNREKSVGRSVITNMAMLNGLAMLDHEYDIICDIDGTLADIKHRRQYVDGDVKDWKRFFAHMSEDEPREAIVQLVREMASNHNIMLVSGRPEEYRGVTEAWLERHKVPYYTLLMRKSGDRRPDTEVKQEILDKYWHGITKFIKFVIDDRPSVIRMWESNGLTVQDVGDGKEF